MLFEDNPNGPWSLDRFWFDFLRAFPPGELYWGRDEDVWRHNLVMSLTHICSEPDEPRAEAIGGGRFLHDVTWTLGNPHEQSLVWLSFAAEIVWPWSAHSWPEWKQEVVEASNRLHVTECENKVLVVATPLFVHGVEALMRAGDILDKCREQYAAVPYNVLHIFCWDPEQSQLGCSIRGVSYDRNSVSVGKTGERKG